jgi:hypothetical protein
LDFLFLGEDFLDFWPVVVVVVVVGEMDMLERPFSASAPTPTPALDSLDSSSSVCVEEVGQEEVLMWPVS